MVKHLAIAVICQVAALLVAGQQPLPAFRDTRLPEGRRVDDLLKQLTLSEKINLLGYNNGAVERLGIPAYNWWNEALHGVARAGRATVFPQAIGLAATFHPALLKEEAGAISTEARAKYNLAEAEGRHQQYMGLTFWSPNINIFRDPRWGRGQETYGEDPFLTAQMGTAFVNGIQGNDPRHLKASACAKHFAVHSGPEAGRHTFNAVVDEKDLRETYLYAFKRLVDAGVEAVMCGYNRLNGEPCCTGQTLLQTILRKEWNFRGHVVTDCGALDDIFLRHKALLNGVETAAAAIKAGVSLDCSTVLQKDVQAAIDQHLLAVTDIDSAVADLLRTELRLGFFDPPAANPFYGYGADSIGNTYHVQLARTAAREGMVLLKNDHNLLPLDKKKYPAIMVVGSNAASLDALLGNYHGVSGQPVDFVSGIVNAVSAGTRVEYDLGCNYNDTVNFGGIWAAGNADVTVAVLGLSPVYEGEEGDAFLSLSGGDRTTLDLPVAHVAYLKALRKRINKPIIAVITAGSAVNIKAIEQYADAIILAWYPGEQGGNALADILFGNYSPSGRLPVTFYQSLADLPPYTDYAAKGHSYRYFSGPVQYPFGYGLSYTGFRYRWQIKPQSPQRNADSLSFTIEITNTGNYTGDEVVQAYVKYPAADRMPRKELKAFSRVTIPKGKSTSVRLAIALRDLEKWDMVNRQWKLYPGAYQIVLGRNADDELMTAEIDIRGNEL